MPCNKRIAQLSVEITNLKKALNLAYEKRKSLIHPEIMAISILLDKKIVQYTRMKNDSTTPEIDSKPECKCKSDNNK